MPHAQPRAGVGDRLLARDGGEQVVDVERAREHADALAARRGRPRLARAVGVELDAVAVGVGQVDRLGDAVVGGAGDRGAGDGEPLHGARELRARGIQQRVVVEAGVAAGAARARLLVQHDEIALAGAERGDRVGAAVQAEPEALLVEADRAVEVGDGEMDRAQPQRGGQGGGLGRGHGSRMTPPPRVRQWHEHRAHRREEKKSTSSAAHSSPSRPPATSGRWLKRGSPSTSMHAAGRARLRVGGAVDDARDAAEHDRARAHRARLERDVQDAVEHPPAAERGAPPRAARGSRRGRSGPGAARARCGPPRSPRRPIRSRRRRARRRARAPAPPRGWRVA